MLVALHFSVKPAQGKVLTSFAQGLLVCSCQDLVLSINLALFIDMNIWGEIWRGSVLKWVL